MLKERKRISLFLIVILISIFISKFSAIVYATTDGSGALGSSGITWTYTAADKTLVISATEGQGVMPDYTTSSKPPFSGKGFTKVIIEEGVTSIGKYTFYDNRNIESVEIASTVKVISDYAFQGYGDKSKLSTIIGMEGVETIGKFAFEGSKITELNVPSLLAVGDEAFSSGYSSTNNNQKLVSVNAPNLTIVGKRAFYNQDNLTTFYAPNLTSIGERAFEGSEDLTDLTIGQSAIIDLFAFKGTPVHSSYQGKKILGIGKVAPSDVIAEFNDYTTILSIKGLGDMQDFIYDVNLYTRLGVSGIDKVVIEEGVTSIGAYMFYDTAHIDEVHIADSVKKIGRAAFSEMRATAPKGLLIVTGMGGVEEISPGAFSGSSNITTFPTIFMSLKIVGDSAFSRVKITSLDAENLETVGKNAFDSTSLTTVYAPKLTSVGERAFYNLSNLSSFTAPLLTSENIGFNAFKGTLVHESYQSIRVVNIGKVNPEDVKIEYNDYTKQSRIYGIGDMQDFAIYQSKNLVGTFSDGYPITSVKIEEGVTNVGKDAFYYTSSYSTNSLESVEIASSVTNIGSSAFRGQTYLHTIKNYSETSQTIGSDMLAQIGSKVSADNRNVYAYSTNETFILAVQGYASNPYNIITLDEVELNPLETTLEDWVAAGNSAESWIDAGNTVDDYINCGGTADSWGQITGNQGTYLWQRGGGTSSSWTLYGGTAYSWTAYGGTPSSWSAAGGTLGSWSAAGGSVEEYQAEVSEEEEDEEQNSNLINVYVDESKVVFPDTQPIVANERILVPVRFIMEELGFEVNWDDVNKKAVMRKVESDGRKLEVIMRPNQSTMTVNGKEYSIGATIQVAAPGRLMLPGGELVTTMQDIFYKEEKLSISTYEGYYYSEDTVGTEPKLADIPVIEDFTDNPNLIELTPENEETILDDEVSMTDILLTAEATNFRATVPFKVDVYMDKMGVITIGEGYKITNQCPLGQIVIVDFEITTVGGWTLVDISENFKAKKINTKEFGLSVNGATALNGSVPLNTSLAEPIRNGESKDLVFDVKIPGQTTEVNQVISSLSIVLDFWK